MTLLASLVLFNATKLLVDDDNTRWTLPELAAWLTEGVKATVLAKPSASSLTREMSLVKGTRQLVPTDGSPEPLMLVDVTRNLSGLAGARVPGRAITPTSRQLLTSQEPYWHDSSRVRFKKEARHFLYDEALPKEFSVYPGNDGTGVVEIVVSTLPAPIAVAAGANVNSLASYAVPVGLPEPYSVPLTDYVCFRAHMKDDLASNAGRGMAHYQAFATAVGLKIQVESATTPNNRRAPQ